jgi:cellulose synthase/poly-beta-1,6-N-acetylglucosamine synthase-like glycosyltransferase
MSIITVVFYLISIILIFFLVLPFLTVAAHFFYKKNTPLSYPSLEIDFGHIITAYRNADIAKGLIQSLIQQNYQNQHIYLVADACTLTDWDFTHPQLTVLNPQPALNLKVKSIIYATERFVRPHTYTVIWDADNLAHPQFMSVMNQWAHQGYKAIQGQRTAKNLDTNIAAVDSFGEFYKNFIERYVPPLLGSSSVISGSGMAVESVLYQSYLYSKAIQEGQHLWKKMMQEDKILQNHIIRADERIVYAKDAICYDEKVTTAKAVETQRSRWLFSYFQNLSNSTGFILRGVITANWNRLLFGLITASPPLFILVGLSGIAFLAGLWIDYRVSVALFLALFIFAVTIFWTLKLSNAPRSVFSSLSSLIPFIFRQFTGLFKMINPNKNFKHSEHTVKVNIDDVLNKN